MATYKPTALGDFRRMSSARPVAWAACVVSLFALAAGCRRDLGGGVPVSGVVTYNGAPLIDGAVTFVREDGAPGAIGFIQNGKYNMNQSVSHKGIPPGNYQVYIQSWIEEPGLIRPDGSHTAGDPRIPSKYMSVETSGLAADVGSRGGTFDFALVGEPDPKRKRRSEQ